MDHETKLLLECISIKYNIPMDELEELSVRPTNPCFWWIYRGDRGYRCNKECEGEVFCADHDQDLKREQLAEVVTTT